MLRKINERFRAADQAPGGLEVSERVRLGFRADRDVLDRRSPVRDDAGGDRVVCAEHPAPVDWPRPVATHVLAWCLPVADRA